jgi:hypothetical protein
MALTSTPADLALHGVRVLGFPTASRLAGRYGLDVGVVQELLLDHEARGWVRQLSFAGTSGWSLTDDGSRENEVRLAAELDKASARDVAADIHQRFLPLNERLGRACTNWQIRPDRGDPMAFNDHTDPRWDDQVLRNLTSLADAFGQLCDQLTDRLTRFDGYAHRYAAAVRRAQGGQHAWIDAPDRDSCHTVWVQFHEDLLATLGIERGSGR